MAYKRFSVFLALRLTIIGLALAITTWLLMQPGYYGATLLAAIVIVVSATELWWFIGRTNREVARFFSAARHADFSQRFSKENLGTGFDELGKTFNDILDRLHAKGADQETEVRRFSAMIDHIPVPLITLHGDDSISLQNNAARRLFGSAHVTKLADLNQFGSSFHEAVEGLVPGDRELVTFIAEGIEHQLTLAATENVVAGESYRLISLQDIQSELDVNQEQAWQDLVRVLTHEIMNSITPVTSLATTAVDVVNDIRSKAGQDSPITDDLSDLHDAITTIAKRSDNLMRFVDSYRQLDRMAPPEKKRTSIAETFESVGRLAAAEWSDSDKWLSMLVEPTGLDVMADRVLLEQVLINLLRNAWQSTKDLQQPEVLVCGRLSHHGAVVIEVSDNGAGVPEDMRRKIFVPFFTTRKDEGSGVGLALARQVMVAHGGSIRVVQNDGGGAKFILGF